jgi:hypothetical protein
MFSNAHRRGCTKPVPDEGTRVATLRGQPADLLFATTCASRFLSGRQLVKTDTLYAVSNHHCDEACDTFLRQPTSMAFLPKAEGLTGARSATRSR